MAALFPTRLFVAGLAFVAVSSIPFKAQAWGKRGHATVCEAAAYLVAAKPTGEFMKTHSYDLGYYCNVPDLVWKRPATYEQEWFNHFMDMEIFEREIKGPDLDKAFAMDRVTFNATYPQVPDKAGRSFWRIRELLEDANKIATELKKTDLSVDDRHKLQLDWLVHVGTAGHYVGDLSQPLHVTENYDGQFSGQKGVHTWFEDDAVDELFGNQPNLEAEVMAAAKKKWKTIGVAWEKKPILEVLEEMAKQSNAKIKTLLEIDKKTGRKDIAKAAHAYHDMIVDRMSTGAVALAGFWGHEIGWPYDGKKFYTFVSDPTFIPTPKAPATLGAPAAAVLPSASPAAPPPPAQSP